MQEVTVLSFVLNTFVPKWKADEVARTYEKEGQVKDYQSMVIGALFHTYFHEFGEIKEISPDSTSSEELERLLDSMAKSCPLFKEILIAYRVKEREKMAHNRHHPN